MKPRTGLLGFVLALLAGLAAPEPAAAEQAPGTSVGVTVRFASRTSLRVSAEPLQFDLSTDAGPASAVVEFDARARTHHYGEVVLTVEPIRAPDGLGGAADVEAAITFAGDGEGTLAGALHAAAPSIAGRWQGSGRRTGRMVFALGTAAPGAYIQPVRFVLTAP